MSVYCSSSCPGHVRHKTTMFIQLLGWVFTILLVIQPVNSSDPCRRPCGRDSFCVEFLGICEGCKSFCDDDPANCPPKCVDYLQSQVYIQLDTTASPTPTQAVVAIIHDSQLQPDVTTVGDDVVEVDRLPVPDHPGAIPGDDGGDGDGDGDSVGSGGGGSGGSGGWAGGNMWWLSIPFIVPLVVIVVVAVTVVHRRRAGQLRKDAEMANIYPGQTARVVGKPAAKTKIPVQATMQDDGRIVHQLVHGAKEDEDDGEVKCQGGLERESKL